MLKLIPGIPSIKQVGSGWCGYATLAMVLRFWGYDITQEKLFAHVNPYLSQNRKHGNGIYLTMGELAFVAMKLTNLRVTFGQYILYKRLRGRRSSFLPFDLLRDAIRHGFPCIIHHIDHFYIVYGFDDYHRPGCHCRVMTAMDSRRHCERCAKYSRYVDDNLKRGIYYLRDSRQYGWIALSHKRLDSMWSMQSVEGERSGVNTEYSLLILRPK